MKARVPDDAYKNRQTTNQPVTDIQANGIDCALPRQIETERLTLVSWQRQDADELLPILEANWNHLASWIPAHVATPSPIPELEERLSGYAHNFAVNKEWRFAMRRTSDCRLLGEIALFPRSEAGRVALVEADRAELGYWLRQDENGHGFATEATAAVLKVAMSISPFLHFEIRCDARNSPSAAIPRRLGFTRSTTPSDGVDVYVLAAADISWQ